MNYSEYAALREEITSRIVLINSQENTAVVMSGAFWTIGFAITMATDRFLFLFLGTILVLLPAILQLPIFTKSGENLYQICALACYIRVFYEYPSIVSGESLMCWESVNKDTILLRNSKRYTHLLNSTYFMVSVVSVVLHLSMLIHLLAVYYYQLALKRTFIIECVAMVICYIVIFNSFKLQKEASAANMFGNERKIMTHFVNKAKSLGVISDEKGTKEIVKEIMNL